MGQKMVRHLDSRTGSGIACCVSHKHGACARNESTIARSHGRGNSHCFLKGDPVEASAGVHLRPFKLALRAQGRVSVRTWLQTHRCWRLFSIVRPMHQDPFRRHAFESINLEINPTIWTMNLLGSRSTLSVALSTALGNNPSICPALAAITTTGRMPFLKAVIVKNVGEAWWKCTGNAEFLQRPMERVRGLEPQAEIVRLPTRMLALR